MDGTEAWTKLWSELPLAGLGRAALNSESADEPAALAELSALIGGYSETRSASWDKVLKLALALAPQRRDLKVFVFLALASFCAERELHDEGAPYLHLGAALHELTLLVEEGWANCLPRNPKARDNQLNFLSQELALNIKSGAPRAKELEAFAACVEIAERLGVALGKVAIKVGSVEYALFREAREALKLHQPAVKAMREAREQHAAKASAAAQASAAPQVAPQVAAPQAAPPQTAAPAPSTTTQSSPPLPPLELNGMEREEVEERLATLALKLAAELRTSSIKDPISYWLSRAIRFTTHALLTEERGREIAANNYRTPLPPPAGLAALRDQAPKWLAEGQFARVIEECETIFEESPLALDVSYFLSQALTGIGATAARTAVSTQLGLLITRCPEIVRYRFGDFENTPFASPETQSWLEAEQQRGGGAPGAGGAEEDVMPPGLPAGVKFLEQRIAVASHGQQRFELELRLIELLLRHERRDVGLPIISALLSRAATYRLEEWRPDLLVRLLRLGVMATQGREKNFEDHAKIWQRLCQISPRDAVELKEKESA